MKVDSTPGFRQNLRRIRDAALRRRIDRKIAEIQAAATINEVSGIGRLRSASRSHYRVRIGEHRIGVVVVGDTATLVRFTHRREFYRNFP
jgi:mRNA-degrading endonuclease RelE of RelBE toxin-antitoxin system